MHIELFLETRKETEEICKPLQIEDYVVQPIDFVSPPKWHMAHTSWFFEQFILKDYFPMYVPFNQQYEYLFNSYYENVGKHWVRADRGNLSRPSVTQLYDYRHYVTDHIHTLFQDEVPSKVVEILTIGIHHEKQHQELLYTDIKYILGFNPLFPAYNDKFQGNTRKNSRKNGFLF